MKKLSAFGNPLNEDKRESNEAPRSGTACVGEWRHSSRNTDVRGEFTGGRGDEFASGTLRMT